MRMRSSVWTLVLVATLAGCSGKRELSFNILPVPPKDASWQGSDKTRIGLPLANRDELVDALRYGLNKANKDRGSATNLNAATTYGDLLALLSKPATLADLSKPEFKKWFPGEMVTQVVDARDSGFAKSHAPVALADAPSSGKYWWIFYRDDHDNLTNVMVINFQALTRLVEKRN